MRTFKKIGFVFCIAASLMCLTIGLCGVVMVAYWYHVTHNWLDDHIFFWMVMGMPSTIAMFAFLRALDLFRVKGFIGCTHE